jgi:hypothetical protein
MPDFTAHAAAGGQLQQRKRGSGDGRIDLLGGRRFGRTVSGDERKPPARALVGMDA